MTKRIIGIFTGNRAEYGLQFPILKAVDAHPDLDYRLVVSGAHLDAKFGRTLEEIKGDGIEVHAEVKIEMEKDNLHATAQAIGSGVLSISKVLTEIRPDIWVCYADRFEGFAAVIAGTQMNFPTAHIEGGDLTEGGALDDSVRHAMTKLSHLHFTTNQQATNRILAMGEEPWRVHTVGFPAIDLIAENNFATDKELIERFALDLSRPIIIYTQHSVTTEFAQAAEQIRPSLEALKKLADDGVQVIITYPNNDAGGRKIIEEIENFKKHNDLKNIQVYSSVGRYYYHGFLALAKDRARRVACGGNSSSGVKETPVFGCPTVNVGSRQLGRLRGQNVTDSAYSRDEVFSAFTKCFDDETFRQICRETDNPYGIGDAGEKIAEILANVKINPQLLRKGMTLQGEVTGGWYR